MVFIPWSTYPVTMTGRSVSVKDLVKAFEAKLDSFSPMPEDVWELRSRALALRTALGAGSIEPIRAEVADLALAVSDTCDKLYKFVNNLIRWMTAKGYTRLATLFDITTIGSLALHDLKEGKWKNPSDILGAAISEGSMIIASLQYTKAQEENIKAMTEDHMSDIYGIMWEVMPMLRGPMTPADIADARDGLDAFFKALRSESTKIETRIAVIALLYLVAIKVRSDKLLENARGLERRK